MTDHTSGPSGHRAEPRRGEAARKKRRTSQVQRDSLALMAAEVQLKKLTYKDLDQRMGAATGFTGKFFRGEVLYTEERARRLRAAIGYDEDRFLRDKLYRRALRKAQRPSLIRSPYKRRARHQSAAPPRPPEEDDDSEEDVPPPQPAFPELLPHLEDALATAGISERPEEAPAAASSKVKGRKKPPAPR
jgi:hypothetical protein